MAGLAGIIYRKNKVNIDYKIKKNLFKNNVEKMLDAIAHRGRKNSGIFNNENNCFGAVTGFISNYTNGKRINSHNINQKNNVFSPELMLDGKIYNIDKIYSKYGTGRLKTISERDKLFGLLAGFKTDIVRKLNGQFAFFFNDRNKNIYLARDFLGRKPLYFGYGARNEELYFASEVKAITPFCNKVSELAPGHFIKNINKPALFRDLKVNQYKNFNLEDINNKANIYTEIEGGANMVGRLNDLLLDSIDKRIPNNGPAVKIGSWLSGGLDSSIIASLLKNFTGDLNTFAVGFKNSKDLEAARVVAKYLGTRHQEYMLDEDELFLRLPETIFTLESFDAPLVRSTLGNIIVSEMSAENDIVFSGEGGDEIFAGYNYFLDIDSKKQVQDALVCALESLHNTALQRVDRSSNSCGVNCKLPMLDEDLVEYALMIPPDEKLDYDKCLTKIVLRKLAEKSLPYDIAWRPKDKFWEGSGIYNIIGKKIDKIITDSDYLRNRKINDNFILRNKEELYYYRIFRSFYPEVDYNNFLSFTKVFN